MRYLPTLVLAIWLCFSSSLAQFNPSTLEPPLDPFNGRTTLIPNTEIVPVEPIINIIQPIQQVFDQAWAVRSRVNWRFSVPPVIS